jgi:non-specific serine/threonine protein kinase/serine/threonine-protein kinase
MNPDDAVRGPEDASTLPSGRDPQAPGSIGNYRLLRNVGEGGMGEVWEAEQERPVRRRVAVKLIRGGLDGKEFAARLESERQALALMDHPNIAKVFDAGTTVDGRPYFVMEYVAGVPITQHCDTHRLDLDQRLRLFLKVCDGVQHAHQKAIIHRDLKPSNILVSIRDGRAEPRIIDFGVAKATAQRLTEQTLCTQLGQIVGTPEYMSPEQAEMTGQDVDTRTDVYSLGVILYELLAGARPFEPETYRRAGLDAVRRMIREVDPPRPSTRVSTLGEKGPKSAHDRGTTPRALAAELSGDLDWIVMKALEKDRARRFGSPAELAADLQRHMENQPILARPPSTRYRVGKFIRRHRIGVVAASAVMVALLAGMAAATWGLVRARRAEESARREAAAAQQVSSFLVDLFGGTDPIRAKGEKLSARDIVDRGAARVREGLRDQPLVRARVLGTIGSVYRNMGLYDDARPLVEEALSVARGAPGDNRALVAAILTTQAMLDRSTGDYKAAEAGLREAIALTAGMEGPQRVQTASRLFSLGVVLVDQGRFAEGESLTVVARDIYAGLDGDFREQEAMCLNNLSNYELRRGNTARTLEMRREALALMKEVHGTTHPLIATALINLTGTGAPPEEDEALFVEARGILRKIFGDEHQETMQCVVNLAEHWLTYGKVDSAEAVLGRLLPVAERTLGPDHPVTGLVLVDLGWVHRARGDYAKAETLYREVSARRERSLGPKHPYTIRAKWQVGRLLVWQGKFKEAEALGRENVATARRALEPRDEELASALLYYGLGALGRGRAPEAEPLLREAAGIRREILSEGDWPRSYADAALGAALAKQGRFAEAESLLVRAGERLQTTQETIAGPERTFVLESLVEMYRAWNAASPDDRRQASLDQWRDRLAREPRRM